MLDLSHLGKIEKYLTDKFGVRNTKGADILLKRCHLDTVLIGRTESSEIWRSLTIEPLKHLEGGRIFKITCETEEELPILGVSKTSRSEEIVFTGEILPKGHSPETIVLLPRGI